MDGVMARSCRCQTCLHPDSILGKNVKPLNTHFQMKILLGAVAALFLMASCSSSEDSKKISPKSTEFSFNDFARCFELVDQPAELSYVEEGGKYYLRLKTTIKMIHEEVKENIDPKDITFLDVPSIATIDLVDEDDDIVASLGIIDEDSRMKLQQLLLGKKGETAEIIFEDYSHSRHIPTWFSKASQFEPGYCADITAEESTESSTSDN